MTASTTIRRAGVEVGSGPRTPPGGTGTATGTSIWDDRSTRGAVDLETRVREVRVSFSIRTATDGVTVGGTSAGVGRAWATAGSGGPGGGSSIAVSSGVRSDLPKRPA